MGMHSEIGIINNTKAGTGLGVYVKELISHMPENDRIDNIILDYDNQQIVSQKEGLIRKVKKYPWEHKYIWYIRASKSIPKCKLYHISNQNISFLNLNPSIVTCYDIFHITHPKNIIYHTFGQFAYSGLKNAQHIIAGSQYTKNMIIKHYKINPRNITVIYAGISDKFKQGNGNGDSLLFQKYNLDKNTKIILHVGNEQPHKNFSSIIRSLNIVYQNFKLENIHLLKVGNPQYTRDYIQHKKLIHDLHLDDKVTFCGYVSEDDLITLYNSSSLFVFPSLHEGFGLPPLEAMACGCPVITSNLTSLPEVVGNAGIMVNPRDVNELATAIFKVLSNECLSEELVKSGLNRVKLFTWEKCARETVGIYDSIINKVGEQ